jgi:uncharacterized protein (DUF697 family)/uncharacterized tellurite resistance protein B-like protein
MDLRQRDALIALCLMASLADGKADAGERERMRGIAAELTGSAEQADAVFQRVQLFSTTMKAEAAELDTPQLRARAYEMAVGIIEADGVVTSAESAFLANLAAELGISADEAARIVDDADKLVNSGLDRDSGFVPPALPLAATAGLAAAGASAIDPKQADIDGHIRTYSILCAALELLPQNLASMAIIPLQMKMVYGVGSRYGYTLSSGHIKDLLATLGVGVTSQVFEGYARRLMGSLLSSAGGLVGKTVSQTLRSIGQSATGATVTFATTYALGKVAQQYYAGGRKLSNIDLQSLFTTESTKARELYREVAPQIEAQARGINPSNIMKLVRGA